MIKNFIIAFWVIFAIVALALFAWYYMSGKEMAVDSFEDCVAAGYPIMESSPRQCRAGSQTFTETIATAAPTPTPVSYKDLIEVFELNPGQKISSPFVARGRARGGWYFEASFPVRVLDATGKELGVGVAQAEGEWMTSNYVSFTVIVNFPTPSTSTGTVEFVKDNPSGEPQFEDKYVFPVTFQ